MNFCCRAGMATLDGSGRINTVGVSQNCDTVGLTTMYGVPADLDLTPFVGSTLDYIGIGKYQIHFVFSGNPWTEKDRGVDSEARWELRDAQSALIDKAIEHDQRESYKVHRLLSRTVTDAKKDPPGSFTFTFDDGSTLSFFDDFDGYESCHVYIGDTETHI